MKQLIFKVKVDLNSLRQFLNCRLHLKDLMLHEKASEQQQKPAALGVPLTTEDLHSFPSTSRYFSVLFWVFFSAGLNVHIYFTFCFSLK